MSSLFASITPRILSDSVGLSGSPVIKSDAPAFMMPTAVKISHESTIPTRGVACDADLIKRMVSMSPSFGRNKPIMVQESTLSFKPWTRYSKFWNGVDHKWPEVNALCKE